MRLRLALGPFRLKGRHGAHARERRHERTFVLRVELEVAGAAACTSDSLQDAVDYETVYAILQEEMQTPSMLLEHLAHRISQRLLQMKGVAWVGLFIEKKGVFASDPEAAAALRFEAESA